MTSLPRCKWRKAREISWFAFRVTPIFPTSTRGRRSPSFSRTRDRASNSVVTPISDDSPCLQGRGFWIDAGVSSHTIRSVHTHQRAKLRATDVLYGTIVERGRVFPHGPAPWNPAKHDSVENVQEN